MQGLYPIIRRKRRPLLPVDGPPTVVGSVEPVNAETVRAKPAKKAKAENRRSETPGEELD